MSHQILEKPIKNYNACLETEHYKTLGKLIARLRFANAKNILTQEKLGYLLHLNLQSVSQIELGVRKLDLFEVKEIATLFCRYSKKMETLRLVLDTYFPNGNHGTRAIYAQTGQLIGEARALAKMSRCELARRVGITHSQMWRIESGNTRLCLLEAWAIAQELPEHEGFRALDDALTKLLANNLVVDTRAS